jgi:hypothetical protein
VSLDIRSMITTAEETLLSVLELGLKRRLPPVADVAALRGAFTQKLLGHRALVYVTAEQRVYRYDKYSIQADDGLGVVAPTPTPPAGRWIRVSVPWTYGPNLNAPLQSRTAGYAKTVLLYRGDEVSEEMLVKADGHTPLILIEWLGDAPKPQSLLPGALYRDELLFSLLLASYCGRNSNTNTWGSPLAAESTEDPGINRLIGDVRYLLAGIQLGIPGIVHVELGDCRKVEEDLEDRLFIYSQGIVVRVGVNIRDEDLDPLRIQGTLKLTDHEPPRFDPKNYVSQGYLFAEGIGPGFTRSYEPGIAFIDGTVVASTPAPRTFAADRDTYRDLLPDGSFLYSEVPSGVVPPSSPGALRIAVTRTDGSGVVSDRFLCSTSYSISAPYPIVP